MCKSNHLFNPSGLQLQERDATTLSSIIEAFKIVCPENLKNGDPDINTTVNMVHICMHNTKMPVSSAVTVLASLSVWILI